MKKLILLIMVVLSFLYVTPAVADQAASWITINDGTRVYGYWITVNGQNAAVEVNPVTNQPTGNAYIDTSYYTYESEQVIDHYDTTTTESPNLTAIGPPMTSEYNLSKTQTFGTVDMQYQSFYTTNVLPYPNLSSDDNTYIADITSTSPVQTIWNLNGQNNITLDPGQNICEIIPSSLAAQINSQLVQVNDPNGPQNPFFPGHYSQYPCYTNFGGLDGGAQTLGWFTSEESAQSGGPRISGQGVWSNNWRDCYIPGLQFYDAGSSYANNPYNSIQGKSMYYMNNPALLVATPAFATKYVFIPTINSNIGYITTMTVPGYNVRVYSDGDIPNPTATIDTKHMTYNSRGQSYTANVTLTNNWIFPLTLQSSKIYANGLASANDGYGGGVYANVSEAASLPTVSLNPGQQTTVTCSLPVYDYEYDSNIGDDIQTNIAYDGTSNFTPGIINYANTNRTDTILSFGTLVYSNGNYPYDNIDHRQGFSFEGNVSDTYPAIYFPAFPGSENFTWSYVYVDSIGSMQWFYNTSNYGGFSN